MSITRQISRAFCSSRIRAAKYDKELLTQLQQKTGTDLYDCRTALRACRNNLEEAEEWLRELASYRAAVARSSSGLVAVTTDKKYASMIDVKCENIFMAAHISFKNFVSRAANLCFAMAKEQNVFENSISKVHLNSSQLNSIPIAQGKKLEDEALALETVLGGSIQLRRAICLQVKDDLLVSACTTNPTNPLISRKVASSGSSGCLLVYKSSSKHRRIPVVAQQLCSHIIGIKPSKIGNVDVDEPHENELEEPCMIYQKFLVEPELEVLEILKGTGISLIEFTRFECGEDIAADENDYQPEKEIIGA